MTLHPALLEWWRRMLRQRSPSALMSSTEDLTPEQLDLMVERMRAEDESTRRDYFDAEEESLWRNARAALDELDASEFASVHSELLLPKGKGGRQDSGGEQK